MRRLLSTLLLCCMLSSQLLGAGITLDFENKTKDVQVEDSAINEDIIVDENLDGEVKNFLRIPDPSWDGESEKVFITNWPSRQTLYGTELISLNNKYKVAPFKPKFEDVSFIKERVVNGLKIPAVYTESFDTGNNNLIEDVVLDAEVDTSKVTLEESRETKILGGDILTLIDKWDIENDAPLVRSYGRDREIPKGLAIQACFKALGAQKYSLYMKTRPHEEYTTMPITKTPFVSMVSSNDVHVDCSKYYTDVYISRSMPDVYWETAHKMGIVETKYDATEYYEPATGEATGSVPENWERLTLGELAVYIKSFLYANGEPVMTKQEEEYLLAVYGRTLPTYLPSHQLEAVKYLMARGIFDTEANFDTFVNGAELMMYLSRAKDKDSRLTFKEIEIEYDKNLVSSGYFPIEVVSTDTNMYNPTWTRPNAASSEFYDYFVKVTDKTRFRDVKGRTVSNIYVSNTYNSTSDYKYPDSEYLGIVNGYYHFRIPVDIINTPACKDGYITINSGVDSDLPGNIKLEYGGGWYTDFEEEFHNGKSTTCYYSKRIPFSIEDGDEFVDMDKKLYAMNDDNLRVFLKRANKVTYTFETDNIDAFRWYGEKITTEVKNGCSYKDGKGNTKIVTITMEETNARAAKIIKQKLTVDSTKGTTEKFPAYMNADDNILVSRSFLNQYFGTCSVTQSEKHEGVFEIRFSEECILVDVPNKRVVSGQAIREFSKDDKSPLVVKYSDGETLIDYRVLQGIINDYLVLNDSESGVKAISATTKRSSSGFKPFKKKDVYPLLGQDTQVQARINDDGYMSLEACYNQANFLLYTKHNDYTSYTELLVFKPKVEGFETSDKVKETLLKDYSIKLGDNENCTIYRLHDNDTKVDTSQNSIYQSVRKDVIKYDKIDGYMYKIPEMSEWDFRTYYEGKESTTSLLPIVKAGNMYIDLNANIDLNNGPYRFPKELLNPSVANRLQITEGVEFSEDKSGGYISTPVSSQVAKNGIQYAPIGLFLNFYDVEEKSAKDILNNKVLYGSMAGTIKTNPKIIGADSNPYYYEVNNNLKLAIDNDEKFYRVNFGNVNGGEIYMHKAEGSSTVGEFKKSSGISETLEKLLGSLQDKNIFDWGKFNLLQTFRNVDDILTLTYIFLLNLVPRIMIMDFLALATLSLVAHNPPVKFFCNRILDIYKVLSLGKIDVESIEPRQIWASTFWATVILSMMQQESLTHLLQWLDALLMSFLSR